MTKGLRREVRCRDVGLDIGGGGCRGSLPPRGYLAGFGREYRGEAVREDCGRMDAGRKR